MSERSRLLTSGPNGTIRAGRADEIPVLQSIELDAARAYRTVPSHAFCVDLPARDEEEHRHCLQAGGCLVLIEDDRRLGFLLLKPLDGRAHVLEVAVAMEAQRKGFGRTLFAEAEAWSKENGFEHLTLTTYRDIAWNAPFYARLGYSVFECGKERPELRAVIAEEAAAGFARVARVAMEKPL